MLRVLLTTALLLGERRIFVLWGMGEIECLICRNTKMFQVKLDRFFATKG